jgi:hypothetical protein
MDFGLTSEQKKTILLSNKETHMTELYSLLVRSGIDPDTFVFNQELPEEDMSMYGERMRIQKIIESISLIESKLGELEV